MQVGPFDSMIALCLALHDREDRSAREALGNILQLVELRVFDEQQLTPELQKEELQLAHELFSWFSMTGAVN